MVLNPKDYLTSHGWEGEGKGLQLNSRSKPITVLQKKNTFGIGKDRDHSYPWWDDVFKSVINKISVKKVDDKDNQLELRRTETGIISHLPSLPPMIDLTKSNLNIDLINDAKRNEAIQNLYRNFRRGQRIEGTVEEVEPTNQTSNQIPSSSSQNANKSVQIGSGSILTDEDCTKMKEKKRKEKKEKKDKKEKKEKKNKKEKKEKKKKDRKDSNEATNTTDAKASNDTNDTTNTNHTIDLTVQKEKNEKKDRKDSNKTTNTTDAKASNDMNDSTDTNHTIDLTIQKQKNEKKDKKEKHEKKEKHKLKESKLKSIKKVIIDEGLNQIFTLDSLNQQNERKLKRKSDKLNQNEDVEESSKHKKKKKRKKEE